MLNPLTLSSVQVRPNAIVVSNDLHARIQQQNLAALGSYGHPVVVTTATDSFKLVDSQHVARSLESLSVANNQASYDGEANGTPCVICGDKGTGKHYGAHSCDGCKGFFRRTIRKGREGTYKCRFDKRCVIDKDHRNRCRYCRFEACLAAGMQRESVQNERDSIMTTRRRRRKATPSEQNVLFTQQQQSRPSLSISDDAMDDDGNIRVDVDTVDSNLSPSNYTLLSTRNVPPTAVNDIYAHRQLTTTPSKPTYVSPTGTSSSDSTSHEFPLFDALNNAEEQCKTLRNSVITRTSDQQPAAPNQERQIQILTGADGPLNMHVATLDDITESMRQQLLLMVEWAKALPPFTRLQMQDQIALLRKFSSQCLLINIAFRTKVHTQRCGIPASEEILSLGNDTCIARRSRRSPEYKYVGHVTARVLDELVHPMRELDITDTEYIGLKAITFFNPTVPQLEAHDEIVRTRQNLLEEFTRVIAKERGLRDAMMRLANLLLILPPLQAIGQGMVENLQAASAFGVARIDSLINELLLAEQKAEPDGRSLSASPEPQVSSARTYHGPPTSAGIMPHAV